MLSNTGGDDSINTSSGAVVVGGGEFATEAEGDWGTQGNIIIILFYYFSSVASLTFTAVQNSHALQHRWG